MPPFSWLCGGTCHLSATPGSSAQRPRDTCEPSCAEMPSARHLTSPHTPLDRPPDPSQPTTAPHHYISALVLYESSSHLTHQKHYAYEHLYLHAIGSLRDCLTGCAQDPGRKALLWRKGTHEPQGAVSDYVCMGRIRACMHSHAVFMRPAQPSRSTRSYMRCYPYRHARIWFAVFG